MSKELFSNLSRLPELPSHLITHIWRNSDPYTKSTLVARHSLPPIIFKEVLKSDEYIYHWAITKPRPLTQIHRAVKATNSLNALLHLSTQPKIAPRSLELIKEKALALSEPMLLLNMILAYSNDPLSLNQLIPAYLNSASKPSAHPSFREYKDITRKYFLATPSTAIVALEVLPWHHAEEIQSVVHALINQNFRSNDPENPTPVESRTSFKKARKTGKIFKVYNPVPPLKPSIYLDINPEQLKYKLITKLQELPRALQSSSLKLEDIYKNLDKILDSLASLTNLTPEDIEIIQSIPLSINYHHFTTRYDLEVKYSISSLNCSFDSYLENDSSHSKILTDISKAKLTHSVTDKTSLIIEAIIHSDQLEEDVYKDITTYLFGPQANNIASYLSKPKYYNLLLRYARNHGMYFIPKTPLRKKIIIDLAKSDPFVLNPQDLTAREIQLVVDHAKPLSALIVHEPYLHKIISKINNLPETQQLAALTLLDGWHSDIDSLIASSLKLLK